MAIEADRICLRFEVRDTGVGIPLEKRALLFQPFQQVDCSDSRRHGGTGLGLAISRRIVELMGGRIGAESAEGKGSTFWFEIPLTVVAAPANLKHEPALDGLRVLVAHDGDIVRRLLPLSLEKLRCLVEAAASGRELLRRLQQPQFDAVLLNSRRADMEGSSLAAAIRAQQTAQGMQHPLRLIALVVRKTAEEREKLLASGVDETLGNPPAHARLKQALLGVPGAN